MHRTMTGLLLATLGMGHVLPKASRKALAQSRTPRTRTGKRIGYQRVSGVRRAKRSARKVRNRAKNKAMHRRAA